MDDLWKNEPPAPTEFAGIRLGRVQAGRDYEAIITSDAMVGRDTHYWKRRTTPCTGPDCPCCLDGTPARWHGYLSVLSTRSRTHHVLELTALAAVPVAEYARRKGSLRGALIQARRLGNRPNSPVNLTCSASDADLRTLPRGVNLKRFLCTIWNIPYDCEDVTSAPHLGPNIRNSLLADPPGSSPQSLRFPIHPLVQDTRKGNGQLPNAPYVGPPQFDPDAA